MKILPICFETLALAGLCFGPIPLSEAGAQRPFPPASAAQAQLANNTARSMVGTGDAISIEEFVIQGSQPKKIIVRGIGPSLAGQGIPNPLQDPVLSLYDGNGVLLARNDNWRDTQEAEIIATAIQPTDDRESAIIATLSPGAYAVTLVGKNHTTGIGIRDIYDLEPQNSVINAIGARSNALPDLGFIISSFVLQGNQSQTILLRALGPSLVASGVEAALLDPALTLFNAQGTPIASNDNWQDTQAAQIQATGLAPTDYRESAMVVILNPGLYYLEETRNSGITNVEEYALPYNGGLLNPTPPLTSAAAVSRKTQGATAYDVPLPLTGTPGIECRSGGASNTYRVVVTFLHAVSFSGAQVTLGTGSVTSATGSGTQSATLNLTGVLSGQTIKITISSVDDGTSVGDLVIPMRVLVGDANGNGTVNATDISSVKAQSGHSITSSNFREDVNADGSINGSDVAIVKSNTGTALSGAQ